MLKKTITFTDYNGTERTEDFYFNLTKAEAIEWEVSLDGGLVQHIEKIAAEQNGPKMFELFKELIMRSYGQKSPDGRRFIKSDELRTEFQQTEAYSILYTELSSDAGAAEIFVNGIIPQVD